MNRFLAHQFVANKMQFGTKPQDAVFLQYHSRQTGRDTADRHAGVQSNMSVIRSAEMQSDWLNSGLVKSPAFSQDAVVLGFKWKR